ARSCWVVAQVLLTFRHHVTGTQAKLLYFFTAVYESHCDHSGRGTWHPYVSRRQKKRGFETICRDRWNTHHHLHIASVCPQFPGQFHRGRPSKERDGALPQSIGKGKPLGKS